MRSRSLSHHSRPWGIAAFSLCNALRLASRPFRLYICAPATIRVCTFDLLLMTTDVLCGGRLLRQTATWRDNQCQRLRWILPGFGQCCASMDRLSCERIKPKQVREGQLFTVCLLGLSFSLNEAIDLQDLQIPSSRIRRRRVFASAVST